jgi:hypothetical protein
LHQRLVERSVCAQEDRDADQAFGAADANFERRALFHHGEQRNDAVIREIDAPDDLTGFVKDLTES